jgi:hypothetical protein
MIYIAFLVVMLPWSRTRYELPVRAGYATVLFRHRRYLPDEALGRVAGTHSVSAAGVFILFDDIRISNHVFRDNS